MNKLNDIFEIIKKENIILEETHIQHKDTKGIYFNVPGIPPTIGISKSIINDRCMYLSILAEELGHHFTTLGDLTVKSSNYSEKLQKNKKENTAKLWAADFLISDEDFVQALYNCISTPCDMCDHFNVTDEILNYKILSIIYDEVKYTNIKNNLKLREIPYNCCTI
ncbi:Zn peptidase [Clostridium beijerinckii]|nr:Zn peptidase [Clostridium beijerinckii]